MKLKQRMNTDFILKNTRKMSPLSADMNHIHHQLLRLTNYNYLYMSLMEESESNKRESLNNKFLKYFTLCHKKQLLSPVLPVRMVLT